MVFKASARAPLAVLPKPVFKASALFPIAVVLVPMMTPGSERLGALPPEETKGAEVVTAVTTPVSLEGPMEPF